MPQKLEESVAVLSSEMASLTKTVDRFVESVDKKFDQYNDQHTDHYKATGKHGRDIAKISGIGAALSFIGLGGIVALFKGWHQ